MAEENANPALSAPAAPPSGGTSSSSDVEKNKVYAILAYLGILFLIPMLAAKDSPFAQYHAKQGMVLLIAEVILSVAGWVLALVWFFGWWMVDILWLVCVVFAILGIINASNGKMQPLPVIGNLDK